MLIECPSGLAFEADPIGGQVFVDVGDADKESSQRALHVTLTTVHKRTVNPGPYPFVKEGGGAPDWERVLFADILIAMFSLRMGSFTEKRSTLGFVDAITKKDDERQIGRIYEFKWSCANADCRKLCDGSVDLQPICDEATPITEELREAIATQKELCTDLPDGSKAFWRWSTLSLEAPMKSLMQRRLKRRDGSARRKESAAELVTKHLKRIVLPDGKTTIGPDLEKLHKWVCQPGRAEAIDILQSHIEARQPSVDNEVTLICPFCQEEQVRVLPFAGSFFFPRSSPQAKRALQMLFSKKTTEEEKDEEIAADDANQTISSGSSSQE